ncbi:MAG TPA: hypothetical protein VMS64_36710 [Candidatus Methylomirabilis sp.]|nr:hypothetical protein [Candidatus Methylomirabilis sp.]
MVDYETVEVKEQWQRAAWPVNWSAIWLGALAAIAVGLIIGLAGVAAGAYTLGVEARIVSWRKFQLLALAWSVAGTFFSFVVGGWVAGKIRGARHAETAALHGASAWLVTVPLVLVLASLGSAGYLGLWYEGLRGTPFWMAPTPLTTSPEAAMIARNAALGAMTALLVGLIGSVIGGWMASGEPMTVVHYRTRVAVDASSK